MQRYLIVLAALIGIAGLTMIARAEEPAAEPFPGYYVCWESHGYPIPQAEPICPEGWTGYPPENPLPVPGITDVDWSGSEPPFILPASY